MEDAVGGSFVDQAALLEKVGTFALQSVFPYVGVHFLDDDCHKFMRRFFSVLKQVFDQQGSGFSITKDVRLFCLLDVVVCHEGEGELAWRGDLLQFINHLLSLALDIVFTTRCQKRYVL